MKKFAILRQGLELLPDNAEILAELERLSVSANGQGGAHSCEPRV